MNKREWAEMMLEELDEGAIFIDGFDEAIIGITSESEPRVVYSEQGIIDALMAKGASEEDAWDHYGFNILGSFQDDSYPIIIHEVSAD